ncbi:hypothetical protein [Prevotella sp. S7 MS 2]|uniref:hypothetical protein n=1 Tax=Prevotella sp. S7 MS 2 TaxID=1287488 RepID=UPI000513F287|nr:hypothetical protein [Prevotella sp. S7 MS 2]KGI60873.1 hypothetical protein HMPREF0671_03460 [Prevotella sp. S7 MS 2]
MQEQLLLYLTRGIAFILGIIAVTVMIKRFINNWRSVRPLALGRNINTPVTCYYPDNLTKFLYRVFFDPQDINFTSYYTAIGLVTLSPAEFFSIMITVSFMLLVMIYKLGKLIVHYRRLSSKIPAVELSAEGIRLITTLNDAAVCYMEDSWSNVKRVFLYRHYAKIITKKRTYYAFHDTHDLDVRDKIAMHFKRNRDELVFEKSVQPSSPNLLLTVLCFVIGPILSIPLYIIYNREDTKSARIYLIASLILPIIVSIFYCISTS